MNITEARAIIREAGPLVIETGAGERVDQAVNTLVAYEANTLISAGGWCVPSSLLGNLSPRHRRTNLDDALDLIDEIAKVRQVRTELKAAFMRSELDGGVKAAAQHPLYIEAEARLNELHDEMMGLI